MASRRIVLRRPISQLDFPGVPDPDITGHGMPGQGSPPAIPIPPAGDTAPGVDVDTGAPPDGIGAGWWRFARRLLASTSIKAVQLPPTYLAQIPGSVPFQKGGFATVTGAGTTTVPNSTLKLPSKSEGTIASVSIFLAGAGGGSLTALNFATFAILVDGSPVPGWASRFTFPRVAVSIQETFDATILVPAGRVISATVNDTDGGTYVVGLFYTGWFQSEAAAKRYRQGQGVSQ
jgi:hypothetical protein